MQGGEYANSSSTGFARRCICEFEGHCIRRKSEHRAANDCSTISEISNVAWKYFRLANFTHDQSIKLAEQGMSLVEKFVLSKEIWVEALSESMKHKHSVYDFMYLIVARRNDAVLLSKNKKMLQLAREMQVCISLVS